MRLDIDALKVAAWHFVKLDRPTLNEVHERTGIGTRSLRRYQDLEEWKAELNRLGWKGETTFAKPSPGSGSGRKVELDLDKARMIYQTAIDDGLKETRALRTVAEALDTSYNRIKYLHKQGMLQEENTDEPGDPDTAP